ncbi:MAG: preprotein translocase subunit Sec61beta [Candidatus Nanohaloarchaea archaeon]|nr:preprotein translocase subunit Sec61beta [Candidatus Nanohaloarchaea archaeon]
MAQNEEQQMPSSFGGLVRYFDEGEQKFQLDPKVVVATILSLITMEIIAKVYLGL